MPPVPNAARNLRVPATIISPAESAHLPDLEKLFPDLPAYRQRLEALASLHQSKGLEPGMMARHRLKRVLILTLMVMLFPLPSQAAKGSAVL